MVVEGFAQLLRDVIVLHEVKAPEVYENHDLRQLLFDYRREKPCSGKVTVGQEGFHIRFQPDTILDAQSAPLA